jgi:putative ABC transport system permease protein
MNLLQTMVSGLRAVKGNRLRSLLTSLGILIGVGALIVTVGIGTGTRASIGKGITRLGTNLITVTPGTVVVNGISQGLGARTTLTMDDVQALSNPSVAPDILAVAPLITHSNVIMKAGPRTWTTSVVGSTSSVLAAYARYISVGSMFTDTDVRNSAHVAVIGQTTADSLFPDGNALDNTIVIQHAPFRVVGLLTVVGATGGFNPDDFVLVPVTTAQETFSAPASIVPVPPGGATPVTVGAVTAGNNNMLTSVQRITISATSRDTIDAARQEVENLLMQTHHITDPSQMDFKITTQQQILDTLDATSAALTLLLAGVAGVALLVGGIGVMNIMLVSVTERVAEIGLRKAVGARRVDILRQFLIESATLSAGGGLLGVLFGGLATQLLPRFTTMSTVFVPGVAVIGVMISAAIGVAFGVFPAVRAARMAPIEALRAA